MKRLVAAILALCLLLIAGAGAAASTQTHESALSGLPLATAALTSATAGPGVRAAVAPDEADSADACDPSCGDETPDGPDGASREAPASLAGEVRPARTPAGVQPRTSHRPATPTRPPRAG